MRLRSLSVQDFGAVASAEVSFEDGLNVLHGPNDLGKSTLASAIRAALLLQHGSSGARPFVPWGTSAKPTVTLVFELENRLWRVHKVFGSSSGGQSVLEWSNDGVSWSLQEKGRGVDGHLRTLLGWGLAAPGGRGGAHGFPKSFLATVLLGEQALPYRLLDQSLEADAEDTGKARLVEALQAMATEPAYQQVLLEAQKRVDEAYTAKGKRSTRKGSPFERVTTEIKQRREASEQLTAQVAESDAVVSRLGDLSARRDRALTVRSEAAQLLERIEAALEQAQQRAALQSEAAAAQAALVEIQRNQEEIARLQAALSEAKKAVPEAEAAVKAAAEAARSAQVERERAQARSEALERGDDPEQRAQAQARAEAMRTLDADAERLRAAAAKLEAWRAAWAELQAAEEAASTARTETEAAEQANVRAEADAKAAAEAHQRLHDANRWARAEHLGQRLEALTEKGRTAEGARAEAEAKRAQASAIEDAFAGAFPDTGARAAIERAWTDLQMREATLQGGFRVALALEVDAKAKVDGKRATAVGRDANIDAEREVVLELPEVGTVTVRPGDPGSHAALEGARAAWAAHADTLKTLGVDTVEGLRAVAADRDAKLEQHRAILRDAELLEAKATPPDPAEVESLRQELEATRRSLEAVDDAACREAAAAHGADLDAAARDAEGEAARLAGLVTTASAHATESRTQLRLATQHAEAARKQEAAARVEGVEGDGPEAAAEALAVQLEAVQAKRETLQAQAAAETQAAAKRVSESKAALEAADGTVQAATLAEAEARTALESARGEQTSAQAALEVRREQAKSQDSFAAAERVAQAEDALAAFPAPTEDLSEEAVVAARERLAAAEEALEDAERAVRQQEGALLQVGGQVVRERAQMAREALEDAERQEAEVELDYEGWRLLLGTLREVENETGAHLGRALDDELAGRLEALSQGRYRGASLGADLETEGVVTAQGVQALERFSEGVKEQVATLLRVSVAEHLGTMLLLDDHLAQTDPGRAEWFRELLRESASGIQIVVLTCRPLDYVREGDSGVHVVDLGSTVTRL